MPATRKLEIERERAWRWRELDVARPAKMKSSINHVQNRTVTMQTPLTPKRGNVGAPKHRRLVQRLYGDTARRHSSSGKAHSLRSGVPTAANAVDAER